MQWYEILVIVCAAAFVVGVMTTQIIRRKKGKTCCDGCSVCSGQCPHCKGKQTDQMAQEEHKTQSS